MIPIHHNKRLCVLWMILSVRARSGTPAEGMGIVAWSPLGGGLLTGKYGNGSSPQQGSRIDFRPKLDRPRFRHDRGFHAAEAVGRVAQKAGISAARIALAWPLYDPRVVAVITGVRTVRQLENNLAAGDWDIPGELKEELDQLTAMESGYLTEFSHMTESVVFGK